MLLLLMNISCAYCFCRRYKRSKTTHKHIGPRWRWWFPPTPPSIAQSIRAAAASVRAMRFLRCRVEREVHQTKLTQYRIKPETVSPAVPFYSVPRPKGNGTELRHTLHTVWERRSSVAVLFVTCLPPRSIRTLRTFRIRPVGSGWGCSDALHSTKLNPTSNLRQSRTRNCTSVACGQVTNEALCVG